MAKYTVSLSKRAARQLDKLPDHFANPILRAIENLSSEPRPRGYKKLKGRDGYRIRIGNYRVIYSIIDKILLVEVIDIGDRKNIYD